MDEADRAQIEIERQEELLRERIKAARDNTVYTHECMRCGETKEPTRQDRKFCMSCQLRLEREARRL